MSRLLLVAHSGEVSGAELVLLGLAQLAVQRGHPVVLAAPAGPLLDQLPAGARHLPLPPLGLGGGPRPVAAAGLAARSALAARRLRSVGADRVVVNSLLALPAVRLARLPAPASWLVHDVVHRADQRLVVRLCRPALLRAVAVSPASAAPLPPGLEVVVAPNGVPVPEQPVGLAPHDPPTVGVVALLTPWKGHLVLLDALARLPGVHLEIAGGSFPGDAGHVARLHERAGRPDLAGRVRFLGHVDVAEAMRSWDVAVSASTAPEAGPLSALEALAMGVPVVGTDHGGTRDLLAGGRGLLVPPGDVPALAVALGAMLADPALRAQCAAAGRLRVAERFDQRRTRPAMLDALLAP